MNYHKVLSIFLTGMSLALTACASPTPPFQELPPPKISVVTPTLAPTEEPSQKGALEQTLKNISYIIEGETITLVNGYAEKPVAPGSANKQVTRYFGSLVELDLNSDGMKDAFFLLNKENGGTGSFFYVVAALKTTTGYKSTNTIFLGDRLTLQSALIDPHNLAQVVVSFGERSLTSTQPTQMISKTFKLQDNLLVEVTPKP